MSLITISGATHSGIDTTGVSAKRKKYVRLIESIDLDKQGGFALVGKFFSWSKEIQVQDGAWVLFSIPDEFPQKNGVFVLKQITNSGENLITMENVNYHFIHETDRYKFLTLLQKSKRVNSIYRYAAYLAAYYPKMRITSQEKPERTEEQEIPPIPHVIVMSEIPTKMLLDELKKRGFEFEVEEETVDIDGLLGHFKSEVA